MKKNLLSQKECIVTCSGKKEFVELNSSRVFICKSVVNDWRHRDYKCKPEVIYLQWSEGVCSIWLTYLTATYRQTQLCYSSRTPLQRWWPFVGKVWVWIKLWQVLGKLWVELQKKTLFRLKVLDCCSGLTFSIVFLEERDGPPGEGEGEIATLLFSLRAGARPLTGGLCGEDS